MKSILLLCALSLFAALRCDAQSPLETAQTHYNAGRYDEALTAIGVAISVDRSADALFLRANIHHKLGHFTEALDDYDRAKLGGYNGDELYLHRGICKTSLMMYESARIDLMHYLEYNPDDARPYYWLASVEYMNMENKSSLRYLDEALAIDSTYADAYYLRAANMAELKKMNLALEDFQSALHYNSKLQRAKLNMAVILIGMGQYDNALEMLSELRLENVDFLSEVLYYRGETLYYLHDLDGACTDWSDSAGMGDRDAQQNHKRVCAEKGKLKNKKRTYFQF
ncbi:MAG: tetratricopeptide repeat protein [Flavobacteriales bacterium]